MWITTICSEIYSVRGEKAETGCDEITRASGTWRSSRLLVGETKFWSF